MDICGRIPCCKITLLHRIHPPHTHKPSSGHMQLFWFWSSRNDIFTDDSLLKEFYGSVWLKCSQDPLTGFSGRRTEEREEKYREEKVRGRRKWEKYRNCRRRRDGGKRSNWLLHPLLWLKSGSATVQYVLHDLEMGGGREPFARVDRRVYPDTSTAGSRTWHLHANHTIDWLWLCVPFDTKIDHLEDVLLNHVT